MTGKQEKEVLEKAFLGNRPALQLTQALFLGLPLTDEEKNTLKALYADENLRAVFKNRLLPEFSKDTNMGQIADPWSGVEEMVFGRDEGTIKQAISYKDGAIKLVRKALALLEDPFGEQIDIHYDPNLAVNDPLAISLLTRNQYIKHVVGQLSLLMVIAEMKDEETPQQTAQRIQKESAE